MSELERDRQHCLRFRKRIRHWKIGGIAAALAGVVAISGCSHPHGGPGWCRGDGYRQVDPEQAAARISHLTDRVLSKVDATSEQKAKAAEIAKAALKDLLPLRERHRAARLQAVQILSQPTIDRSALEQLRSEQMQLADEASKRLTQALADTAEILTPEQRTKLAEHWKKRMG